MAQMIATAYKEGNKSVLSQVRGFVEAREVFGLLKTEMSEWDAIQFYDEWCYFRYTGRIMEA
jgi:hypothetical protein